MVLPHRTAVLPDSELRRYARHLMLPGAGLEGQQRLKAARVLVVGVPSNGPGAVDWAALTTC